MSNTIIKKIEIQHPTTNVEVDIGAEAQSVTVSRDVSGTVIVDLDTEVVDSTESLAEALKRNESPFTGATSSANGTKGLVPQPLIADENKFLRGDGTWGESISGSSITITSLEASLNGKQVSISDGTHTKTGTFDSSGICTITGITFVGNLTITSTDGTETATKIVNMPYFGVYATTLSFWAATVNITGSDELKGALVTVKNSSDVTVGTVTLSLVDATGVFTASEADTYSFNYSYDGENYSESLIVSEETTYNISLTVSSSFDYQAWLDAGRVSGTYSSLDEILSDEECLRQLMLVHDSVDYLAAANVNEDIEKIFNNDLAAKWINLSDYALDTFYAVPAIKTVMDIAGKYGYGEWALVGQVPKMTSNTAPSGRVIYKNQSNDYPAWKAFDGETTGGNWYEGSTGGVGAYLGYTFPSAVKCSSLKVLPRYVSSSDTGLAKYKVQGSNDGFSSDIHDLTDEITPPSSQIYQTVPFTKNLGMYSSYRIYLTENTPNGYMDVYSLQFYAWAPKGNVPVMTGNSAPYGEAGANVTRSASGYAPYYAFNGSYTDDLWWTGDENAGNYIYYKHTNPHKTKKIGLWYGVYVYTTSRTLTIKFQGSNTGDTNDWTDIKSFDVEITGNVAPIPAQYIEIDTSDNENYYLYERLLFTGPTYITNVNMFLVSELQFYGRSLDVSVPVMTGNTVPYGEVVYSNQYDSNQYAAYRAFDNSTSNHWRTSDNVSAGYIGFKFNSNVCVKYVSIKNITTVTKCYIKNFKVQGGPNVSNLTDITETLQNADGSATVSNFQISNDEAYPIFVINYLSSWGSSFVGADEIQFFGVDYSEKEFEAGTTKKWLYDHGVEVTPLTPNASSGCSSVIGSESIELNKVSGTSIGAWIYNTDAIDFTPYKVARCTIGDILYYSNTSGTYLDFTLRNAANRYVTAIPSTVAGVAMMYGAKTFGFDITSITSSLYLGVAASTNTASDAKTVDITELWVE